MTPPAFDEMELDEKVRAINKAMDEIRESGPRRVLVNGDGNAVPPGVAAQLYGTKYDIVFIRCDGWSLGATASLRHAARELWYHSWIACAVPPYLVATPLHPNNGLPNVD